MVNYYKQMHATPKKLSSTLLVLFCVCVFQVSLENSGILCVKIASSVSAITEAASQMESRATNASNKEISIQWYIPSLAKPTNDTETKVQLHKSSSLCIKTN